MIDQFPRSLIFIPMKKLLIAILFIVAAQQAHTQTKAKINHLAIFVQNLSKSGYFYTQIMGLDTIPEPFHDGKHLWLSIGGGAAMHIIEGASERKDYYKNQHTCFSVPDINAFVKKLDANKIGFEDVSGKKQSITTRVDGVHQIWFQDPDGYWIEVNDAK